jgi:hypothetical protein
VLIIVFFMVLPGRVVSALSLPHSNRNQRLNQSLKCTPRQQPRETSVFSMSPSPSLSKTL